MDKFTGTDVYGIRWWVLKLDDNDDNFLSRIKYMVKYDSIMSKQQIQHARNEYEKTDTDEMKNLLVQVFVYNNILGHNIWWHVDKNRIHMWFKHSGGNLKN
jgi:hypothetical protein